MPSVPRLPLVGDPLRRVHLARDLASITTTAAEVDAVIGSSEGGLHDFYSNADYWWPDPSKPDGLPYVQRDGESNPQNFNEHRRCVTQLRDAQKEIDKVRAAQVLAVAGELTGRFPAMSPLG